MIGLFCAGGIHEVWFTINILATWLSCVMEVVGMNFCHPLRSRVNPESNPSIDSVLVLVEDDCYGTSR